MNRMFIFLPENDIALASDLENFTPPTQAAHFRFAGCMLPFWLGNANDKILVSPNAFKNACQWKEYINIEGPAPVEYIDSTQDFLLMPWGWSKFTLNQFRKAGLTLSSNFPNPQSLTDYRLLSHRRSSISILSDADIPPRYIPVEAYNWNTVVEAVNKWGDAFIKSPWSCSGRGVFKTNRELLSFERNKIEGIIRRQGSVLVENAQDGLLDFAMLFYITETNAEYEGLSVFENEGNGRYSANIVDSQNHLKSRILNFVAEGELEKTKTFIQQSLKKLLFNKYQGPVGVDMMIIQSFNGNFKIWPLIEINLRYTMGFIAKGIFDKIGISGKMKVEPIKADSPILAKENPLSVFLSIPNPWFNIIFTPVISPEL